MSNITGTPTFYGGGGAAYAASAPASLGEPGLGGGGTSSTSLDAGLPNGGPGQPNTGGGGGARYSSSNLPGGIGGSGIVVIRYPIGFVS
jgi:hypothetical protein